MKPPVTFEKVSVMAEETEIIREGERLWSVLDSIIEKKKEERLRYYGTGNHLRGKNIRRKRKK